MIQVIFYCDRCRTPLVFDGERTSLKIERGTRLHQKTIEMCRPCSDRFEKWLYLEPPTSDEGTHT